MAIVKKYKAEVISIHNPFDTIYTIEFKSVSGTFRYLPGQFLHLALDEYDPSSGWPDSRCFSMQTSPSNETLKITFAVKGKFTKRMADELKVGKVIDIKLPYGELFQQEHSKSDVVFIAGGTGITPFLSVFCNPTFSEYSNPILYFGIRNSTYNIYKNELSKAKEINPSLNIQIVDQEKEGILNIASISNKHGHKVTYFISGPQPMIASFKEKLLTKGVPISSIKTDDWE
jgi:predicted ferric reductase